MTTKPKIMLTNSSKYRFQHLLRHFNQALILSQAGEYLLPPDLFRTLDAMGYLNRQKSQKDYELVSSIIFMLAQVKGQGIITRRNLFRFLMVIEDVRCNIEKYFQKQVQPLPKDVPQLQIPLVPVEIGTFTNEGRWNITQRDQLKVRQIFGHMFFSRVSRHDISSNSKKTEQNQQENYQPSILSKSIILAQQRFKKSGAGKKVEDRLLFGKSLYDSRREVGLRESLQKQLKQCSFRPRINSMSRPQLKQNSLTVNTQDKLLAKGRQYNLKKQMLREELQDGQIRMQKSQCSFKPDLSLSFSSLRQSMKKQLPIPVKNEEKSVSRVRIARKERQGLNECNSRGYPKGISWLQFLENVRDVRTCSSHINSISQTQAILSIDLKILGQKKHLQVKEADNIDEIAERICAQSKLNGSCYERVLEMVEHSIGQCQEIVLKNRQVYLKIK